jgi:hypothetical protein
MRPKTSPEFEAFTNLTDLLLSVPHTEIQKRMKKYKEEAAKNPHRRGPKPKATASVSRAKVAEEN